MTNQPFLVRFYAANKHYHTFFYQSSITCTTSYALVTLKFFLAAIDNATKSIADVHLWNCCYKCRPKAYDRRPNFSAPDWIWILHRYQYLNHNTLNWLQYKRPMTDKLKALFTRSSATAEKQRISWAYLPRLTNWSWNAQNTAESQRLYYFWHANALMSDWRSAGRKRILS